MMSTNFPFKHLAEEVQFGYASEASADLSPALFSPADRLKWEQRETVHRKQEFLLSRSALATALHPHPLSSVHYKGKQPNHEAGHISLSHAKKVAIAAYSPTLELGVDVEEVRPQIGRIAHKFIRPDEEKYLTDLGTTHAQQLLWGLKESLFNLFGSGNVDLKNTCTLLRFILAVMVNTGPVRHGFTLQAQPDQSPSNAWFRAILTAATIIVWPHTAKP